MSRYRGAELLLTALQRPENVVGLDLTDWETLLRAARRTRLLAHLGCRFEHDGLVDQLPAAVVDQLHSARTEVRYHQRHALWELNRLQRALGRAGVPFVVIKGGAYLVLDLPLACGREMRDIDLLVPYARIDQAEQALAAADWGNVKLDEYDQRYYRDWMHELPPLRHPQRVTEVDLHHTILPRTSRLRPNPALLFEQARATELAGIGVLSRHDMLLHSAVHLFYDGALDRDLRDLVDLDAMLRTFSHEPGFWERLVPRAEALDLQRPLYYALRYTVRLLDTPVPDAVIEQASRAGAPNVAVRQVMDRLVPRVLLPSNPRRREWTSALARWLLYLRSHWLRMPPLMLAKHLWHKGVISRPQRTRQPF